MHARDWWKISLAFSVLAAGLMGTPEALAYDQFSLNGGDATNCGTCHGNFRQNGYTANTDGQNWGNIHNLHRQTMVSGDCDTCHSSGGRFPTFLASSAGGSGLSTISCVGCHGREEDDVAANPDFGTLGGRGAGLRQHHHTAGITTCATCHQDADPANYTPVGEEILPDYYANPGTGHGSMPTDPCNPGGSEDFAGDAEGLDNDGDGLYDGADPDCTAAVCGNGSTEGGEDCDDSGESATCDADCTSVACDDGTLNTTAGETCDPISSCPATCDDGDVCTTDGQTGAAATCDLVCTNTTITMCTGGDGCCAAGCTPANDSDCAGGGCGNGFTDAGEDCDDAGESATCDADCTFVACGDGTVNTTAGEDCEDGGETATCDADCTFAVCGDSTVNATAGEDCDDGGETATCDANCTPVACDDGTLNVSAGETCDPVATCPATCDDADACTTDGQTGAAATCDLVCTQTPVTACTDGDGCCAPGCNPGNDDDCTGPWCGNGTVEGSETCDGDCPTTCDDTDACTIDSQTGSESTCDLVCVNAAITACIPGDGCCATGCVPSNDDDCVASTCGDGVVEGTETCDGDCPASCDDGDVCTTDSSSGSAGSCDLLCSNLAVTACVGGDGCCAPGCTSANDSDCAQAICGNGVLEGSETCDGNCPASCDDGDACTADSSSGSAATCDLLCLNEPITSPECPGTEPPDEGEGCDCMASPGAARPGALLGFFLLGALALFGRRRGA